jgi:hypothetical protein
MQSVRAPIVCGLAVLALCIGSSRSATFYVDPESGSISGDGTSQDPWSTLQEVIEAGLIETQEGVDYPYEWGMPLQTKNAGAPVTAGDTILLRSGYHGSIEILRAYNTDYITIAAEQGHTPQARNISLTAAAKWVIGGLTLSPEFASTYDPTTLVSVVSHNWSGPSREVVVENCTMYSMADASGWSSDDWNNLTCNAIGVSGVKVTVRNCYAKNVDFGISVSGDSCLVERCTVENFAGDGLRGLGDYDRFYHNTVMNCYDVNANHDDGFQSWSVGAGGVGTGVVLGVELVGNTIINYTDPNQPFRGTLQGVGCFDGFFEDWVIENNVVITDHWHGITLLGARNCRIVNNTVCDLNTASPGPPWISIDDHKDGTASSGCIIRNNLTSDITAGAGVTEDHNIIIQNPDDFFVDYAACDMRLKAGCDAVDAGSPDLAPSTDMVGTVRPQDGGYDVGAYEYVDPAVVGRGARRHVSSSPRITVSIGAPSSLCIRMPGGATARRGAVGVELLSADGRTVARIANVAVSARGLAAVSLDRSLPAGIILVRVLSDCGESRATACLGLRGRP